LGPLLGGFIALVWQGFAWQGEKPAAMHLGTASVYFLAGLSPRFVADRIGDVLRRAFLGSGLRQGDGALPLTNIRGITTLIEDRLYEEGIFDVYGLAMASPFRLLINTPYDKRQIASWIDEAILITVAPRHWDLLQKEGITGAIDLATYAPTGPDPFVPAEIPPSIEKLATIVKADKQLLFDLARRLAQDMQVRLIWGLYQTVSTIEVGTGSTTPTR
jgi:hypothetical protein